MHSFHSMSFWSWQNLSILQKNCFLISFRGSYRENSSSSGVGQGIQSCCKYFIQIKTLSGQIWNNWRLPEGEDCKIGSSSLRYKLFKISFLTTFSRPKHFMIIQTFFVKSLIFSNLENCDLNLWVWSSLEAPGRRRLQNKKFIVVI